MLEKQSFDRAGGVESAPLQAGALLSQALAQWQSEDAADFSQAQSILAAGQVVGPFRLVRVLGSGGMGEVWLAERCEGFAQQVAIKWAHSATEDQHLHARFAQERALLATLDHPGIARLVDGGSLHGALWFAMEYVQGKPLSALIADYSLSLQQRLQLMLQLCAAVHYAHQRLIVHRDLKPANVIVDDAGRARLLDFGIAKRLDSAPELTQYAQPLTLLYAAPEQIRGAPVSTAADVYALGATFYQLLTGACPHPLVDGDRLALLDAITNKDATLPSVRIAAHPQIRLRGARIKGDLDTIVLKALARDPERRYPSALALANDIRAFVNDLPISSAENAIPGGKIGRRTIVEQIDATPAVAQAKPGTAGATQNLDGDRDRQRGTAIKRHHRRYPFYPRDANSAARRFRIGLCWEVAIAVLKRVCVSGLEAEQWQKQRDQVHQFHMEILVYNSGLFFLRLILKAISKHALR